jgi:hypothetical protein
VVEFRLHSMMMGSVCKAALQYGVLVLLPLLLAYCYA